MALLGEKRKIQSIQAFSTPKFTSLSSSRIHFGNAKCYKEGVIYGSGVLNQRKSYTTRLNDKQIFVIDCLLQGHNISMEGPPGSGKSEVIRNVIRVMETLNKKIVCTAATGQVAANIKGITFHSAVGIGIGKDTYEHYYEMALKSRKLQNKWCNNADLLIVDEQSMIDPEYCQKAEYFVTACRVIGHINSMNMGRSKKNRYKAIPFPTFEEFSTKHKNEEYDVWGGLQVCFVGDYAQLPPVLDNDDKQDAEGVEFAEYLFQTRLWQRMIQKTIYLTDVFRQNNQQFVETLQRLRLGKHTPDDIKLIMSRDHADLKITDGIHATNILGKRVDAERMNRERVFQLPKPEFQYLPQYGFYMVKTDSRGNIESWTCTKWEDIPVSSRREKNLESLKDAVHRSCNADDKLPLRYGTLVSLTVNMKDYGLHNGSQGIVIDFVRQGMNDSQLYPVVKFTNGRTCVIGRMHWFRFAPDIDTGAEVKKRRIVLTDFKANIIEYIPGEVDEKSQLSDFPDVVPLSKGAGNMPFVYKSQLPLRIAYAGTAHRWQGAEMDRAEVDCTGMWEYGQHCMALSRVRSLEGLSVKGFDATRICAHPDVVKRYEELEQENNTSVPKYDSWKGVVE